MKLKQLLNEIVVNNPTRKLSIFPHPSGAYLFIIPSTEGTNKDWNTFSPDQTPQMHDIGRVYYPPYNNLDKDIELLQTHNIEYKIVDRGEGPKVLRFDVKKNQHRLNIDDEVINGLLLREITINNPTGIRFELTNKGTNYGLDKYTLHIGNIKSEEWWYMPDDKDGDVMGANLSKDEAREIIPLLDRMKIKYMKLIGKYDVHISIYLFGSNENQIQIINT